MIVSGIDALIKGLSKIPDEQPKRQLSPLQFMVIGFITGFGSAITGTGGPLILVPLIIFLGLPVLTAIGLSQAIQLPIAAFASAGNWMSGNLNFELALVIAAVYGGGFVRWCGTDTSIAGRTDPQDDCLPAGFCRCRYRYPAATPAVGPVAVLSLADLVRDYGDPHAEAMCCRQDCALFDFSFVYRIRVSGRNAIARIEQFQPRSVSDMSIGQIRYSVKLNAQGRVRSDLTLWRYAEDVFEIMSGCAEDVSDLHAQAGEEFNLQDLSESTAILSLQGPNTLAQLACFMDVTDVSSSALFSFCQGSNWRTILSDRASGLLW